MIEPCGEEIEDMFFEHTTNILNLRGLSIQFMVALFFCVCLTYLSRNHLLLFQPQPAGTASPA